MGHTIPGLHAGRASPRGIGLGLLVLLAGLLGLWPVGSAYAASALDLSVSSYTWTPDPAVNGGTSTFTVTVTNNEYFWTNWIFEPFTTECDSCGWTDRKYIRDEYYEYYDSTE